MILLGARKPFLGESISLQQQHITTTADGSTAQPRRVLQSFTSGPRTRENTSVGDRLKAEYRKGLHAQELERTKVLQSFTPAPPHGRVSRTGDIVTSVPSIPRESMRTGRSSSRLFSKSLHVCRRSILPCSSLLVYLLRYGVSSCVRSLYLLTSPYRFVCCLP